MFHSKVDDLLPSNNKKGMLQKVQIMIIDWLH